MNKKSRVKLVIRSIILLIVAILYFIDMNLIKKFFEIEIVGNIKLYVIFWCYLMYEMLIVLIPKFSTETHSGKIYLKHYKEASYDVKKLKEFTKTNTQRAKRAGVFWVVLNLCIWIGYKYLELNEIYMYILFLFYYWSDMFCINVWCPFHKIIVRNKCCNECRIYNWGHLMYLTPLIYIKNIFTYSLVLVGVLLFIQWEYLNKIYPQRMSSLSNKSLRCSECVNDCRFNKSKRSSMKKSQAN